MLSEGQLDGDVRLSWRPERRSATSGASPAVMPDRIHISVSPNLKHSTPARS